MPLSGAQWVAFDDSWRRAEAEDDCHAVAGDIRLADTMEGLRRMLGDGPSRAYLSYMANRLRECWRVLSSTGSIYLHCGPTMSHCLKVLMGGTFQCSRFQNEFIWYYSGGGASTTRWARKHDVILFYSKGKTWAFNADAVRVPYGWAKGQRRADGSVRDYRKGKLADDVWQHNGLMPWSKEKIGLDIQKSLALLQRIISASRNIRDTVLDPFCGCGTTAHASQNLGRRWIEIDVSASIWRVIEKRLGTAVRKSSTVAA